MEIVERAGHPTGGLCIDIWHPTRAGDDRTKLRSIGADRIICVQMSDGPRRAVSADLAGYKDDCLRNWVPPVRGRWPPLASLPPSWPPARPCRGRSTSATRRSGTARAPTTYAGGSQTRVATTGAGERGG
jgi:hypothetical protein